MISKNRIEKHKLLPIILYRKIEIISRHDKFVVIRYYGREKFGH